MGAGTHGSGARSESELPPQCPEQVQRSTYLEVLEDVLGGGGWLWLMMGARTLTAETAGKYYYCYYFLMFCCFIFIIILIFIFFILIF